MKRKWIPEDSDKIYHSYSEEYHYIYGWYNHEKYGRCFRIAKHIRANDYFIGHFVVVEKDADLFTDFKVAFDEGKI